MQSQGRFWVGGALALLVMVALVRCGGDAPVPTGTEEDRRLDMAGNRPSPASWQEVLADPRLLRRFQPAATGKRRPQSGIPAGAIRVHGTREAFDAAFPGLPVEDFENRTTVPYFGLPNTSVCMDDGPWNHETNDACFSPGAILPGISFSTTPKPNRATKPMVALEGGIFGVFTAAIGPTWWDDDLIITFTEPVCAVGLDWQDPDFPPEFTALTIRVYGPGDVPIGSIVDATEGFVGISAAGTIARIEFDDSNHRVGELVDDVAFGCACQPNVQAIAAVLEGWTGMPMIFQRLVDRTMAFLKTGNPEAIGLVRQLGLALRQLGLITQTEFDFLLDTIEICAVEGAA